MPNMKEAGKWALAALVVMYAIRYLRASNQSVGAIFPATTGTTTAGATQ